jgi:hypothetical protein
MPISNSHLKCSTWYETDHCLPVASMLYSIHLSLREKFLLFKPRLTWC